MMQIRVTTYLAAPPATVRGHVKTSRLLAYVSGGILSLQPIDPPALPAHWSEGKYLVRMRLFGLIPLGQQYICIENPAPAKKWVLRDNGAGTTARVWDHHIYVLPEGAGTRYIDHVRIEAGVLTPLVVVFACALYRYRQYRWRRLVRHGFDFEQ
jgi:hypothetical protein